MTPEDIEHARKALGEAWGLKRALFRAELGRAAGLTGKNAGRTVRDWEEGKYAPSSSAQATIAMLLGGADPPGGREAVLLRSQASREGGLARAASLTPERRMEIALQGRDASQKARRAP